MLYSVGIDSRGRFKEIFLQRRREEVLYFTSFVYSHYWHLPILTLAVVNIVARDAVKLLDNSHRNVVPVCLIHFK